LILLSEEDDKVWKQQINEKKLEVVRKLIRESNKKINSVIAELREEQEQLQIIDRLISEMDNEYKNWDNETKKRVNNL